MAGISLFIIIIPFLVVFISIVRFIKIMGITMGRNDINKFNQYENLNNKVNRKSNLAAKEEDFEFVVKSNNNPIKEKRRR